MYVFQPGLISYESAGILEQSANIAALYILQHHAQVSFCLETTQHGHYKRVLDE